MHGNKMFHAALGHLDTHRCETRQMSNGNLACDGACDPVLDLAEYIWGEADLTHPCIVTWAWDGYMSRKEINQVRDALAELVGDRCAFALKEGLAFFAKDYVELAKLLPSKLTLEVSGDRADVVCNACGESLCGGCS